MQPQPYKQRFTEWLIVSLTMSAVVVAQLRLGKATSLFDRHLWLDEVYSYRLSTDPSVGHSLRALAGGVDYNPPALYLTMRAVGLMAGGLDERSCRAFAFASIWLALAGLYVLLRRRFSPLIAAAAVFATWAHPLVLYHAFESRFYGPWAAALAWLAVLLPVTGEPPPRAAVRAALAACSVFVCTVHYFGVVSLMIVIAAHCYLGSNRPSRAVFASIACGPTALLIWAPAYVSQRAALSLDTWVAALHPAQVHVFVAELLGPVPIAAAAVVAGFSRLVARLQGSVLTTEPDTGPSPFSGITGLLLFPWFLLGLTILVQPCLLPRYGFVMVLALAPIIALLLAATTRPLVLCFAVLCFCESTLQLFEKARDARESDAKLDALLARIRELPPDLPVAFESFYARLVAGHYAPELTGRSFVIDFEPFEGNYTKQQIIERDIGRAAARAYPDLRTRSLQSLRELDQFAIVTAGTDDGHLSRMAPGHGAKELHARLFLLAKED